MHKQSISYLLIFLLSDSACHRNLFKGPKIPEPRPKFGIGLASFDRYGSCEDLKADLRSILINQMDIQWRSAQYYKSKGGSRFEDVSIDSASTSAPVIAKSASPIADSTVSTNLQVNGVDEADEIKMGDKAIFIADNQQNRGDLSIAIVQKSPLKDLGSLLIRGLSSPQLYTRGDQLIVTGIEQAPFDSNGFGGESRFAVKVFDVKSTPVLQNEFSLPSLPVATRMIDGKLFAVLQDTLPQKQALPYPSEGDLNGSYHDYIAKLKIEDLFEVSQDAIAGIKCQSMAKLPPFDGQLQVQRVISYDVSQGKLLDEIAIPGADQGIYMSEHNIYTYGNPSSELTWVSPEDTEGQKAQVELARQIQDTLLLKKISFDPSSGKLTPMAMGTVEGHLKSFDSSWAFHEMQKDGVDLLSVVTSKGNVRDENGQNPASNHLIVLRQQDKELVEAASIKDFGQNEDVRSVRYLGNLAYVVTFKRTDPLFTIDLSDPLAPKMVGELKIPGFSLYMQPHGEQRMLGLGYQTEESGETDINRAFFQGVLLQLFDLSDPSMSRRLDFIELGRRGSYSEANQDHHAYYYDPAFAMTGVPVVLFDDGAGSANPNGQTIHRTRSFSGAVFYRIFDKKLEEIKRVSHFDIIGPTCKGNLQAQISWTSPIVANPEVRRIFRDGQTVFTVSNFGVKTFDATSLSDLASVKLLRPDCQPRWGGGEGE